MMCATSSLSKETIKANCTGKNISQIAPAGEWDAIWLDIFGSRTNYSAANGQFVKNALAAAWFTQFTLQTMTKVDKTEKFWGKYLFVFKVISVPIDIYIFFFYYLRLTSFIFCKIGG